MPDKNDPGVRFWPRLGLYISKIDAEEYISKTTTGTGAVLDEVVEEFSPSISISPEALRVEIDALFENPFEEGKMSDENQAIIAALTMEKQRIPRIKELMAEGMDKVEAKKTFDGELDIFVREALGLPEETEQETEYRLRALAIREGKELGEEE
tara:strand:- start:1113 stop:1574 length:462 start_codon:yes stop_codon:yes gene_type:complete